MRRNLLSTGGIAVALAVLAAPTAGFADEQLRPGPTAAIAVTTAQVDADKIIGRNIFNRNGEIVGVVESVILDNDGEVRFVVVGVGGFLGIGEKSVALTWEYLTIHDSGDSVVANVTKEQLEAFPEYKYPEGAERGTVLTSYEAAVGTPASALKASGLIGLEVRNLMNETIGEISDLVLSDAGSVDGVVIDVGGFFGLGERSVLVKWRDVKLVMVEDRFQAIANLSQNQLSAMPEYSAPLMQ